MNQYRTERFWLGILLPLAALLLNPLLFSADSFAQTPKGTQPMHAMLQPWTGPYGGVPPWHLVRPEEFVAAFDQAIQMAKQEIEAIAEEADPPTLENTIIALESAGKTLDRLESLFGVYRSNLNLGPVPDVEKIVAPKLTEFADQVTQNEKLFARIATVFESRSAKNFSLAQQRLVEDRYKKFVRQGARLSKSDKAKLSRINKRLAGLFTTFSQNVLSDEQSYVTWIENEDDLTGLPQSTISAMAVAAKVRNQEGKWAVTNTRSSMAPLSDVCRQSPATRKSLADLLRPRRQRGQA